MKTIRIVNSVVAVAVDVCVVVVVIVVVAVVAVVVGDNVGQIGTVVNKTRPVDLALIHFAIWARINVLDLEVVIAMTRIQK